MKVLVDASLLVYLNVRMPEQEAKLVEDFWLNLLRNHELYTDVLALDEAIYVSRRKYGVGYEETLKLIDKAVLPYVEVIPLGGVEYVRAKEFMLKYGLTPSDALHVATVIVNELQAIASEDRDFDRVGIKRLWVK